MEVAKALYITYPEEHLTPGDLIGTKEGAEEVPLHILTTVRMVWSYFNFKRTKQSHPELGHATMLVNLQTL